MIGASMNNRAVPTTALGVAIVVLLSLTVLPAQKATEREAQAAATASLSPLDRIQIQQLVRKYAWALDSGDNYGYAFADLFTPDGVFVGTNQGASGRSYQGRDQLAALARGGTRGATQQSHFTMNHVITPASGGAIGRAYVVIVDVGIVGKPNAVNHGGHYDDVYEKTSAGWRFKKRTYWESQVGATEVKR
jgi:uncharacterized protein (TIGR02246 family)